MQRSELWPWAQGTLPRPPDRGQDGGGGSGEKEHRTAAPPRDGAWSGHSEPLRTCCSARGPRKPSPDAVFVGHGDAGRERVELHHGGDARVPVEEDLIIQPGNTCGCVTGERAARARGRRAAAGQGGRSPFWMIFCACFLTRALRRKRHSLSLRIWLSRSCSSGICQLSTYAQHKTTVTAKSPELPLRHTLIHMHIRLSHKYFRVSSFRQ